MLALAQIDKALSEFGIAGGPVIWCHDEIVLEVREEDGERAASLLGEVMRLTFERTFPGAPLTNLVEPLIGMSWGEARDSRPTHGCMPSAGRLGVERTSSRPPPDGLFGLKPTAGTESLSEADPRQNSVEVKP